MRASAPTTAAAGIWAKTKKAPGWELSGIGFEGRFDVVEDVYKRQEYDILITGDLSKMAEYRVLARHALPDIELLVAGHHGAKTSTSEALLEITQPETVFLSVGEGNRYGHPAAETLETIEKYGAEGCLSLIHIYAGARL